MKTETTFQWQWLEIDISISVSSSPSISVCVCLCIPLSPTPYCFLKSDVKNFLRERSRWYRKDMELTYPTNTSKVTSTMWNLFSQNTYWKLVENLAPARLSERSLWDQHIWFCHVATFLSLRCTPTGMHLPQKPGLQWTGLGREYSVWLHRGSPKCLHGLAAAGSVCRTECGPAIDPHCQHEKEGREATVATLSVCL